MTADENFAFFSNEYAQALQALKAIEEQSPTLIAFGGGSDLRGYVDQFIDMATGAMKLAEERGETNFAEWFRELIGKAEALRGVIAGR